MIKVKIVPEDTKKVAKVIIVDDDSVLMLKRSNYVEKYAGEWDLPGGHIQVGEEFSTGMKREVKEETGLDIESPVFVGKLENLEFYTCKYNGKPIKTSHEHTGFRFFKKTDLDPSKKFDKMALKALEIDSDKA
jgi:8-oxo-dGTP diphosphatase